MRGASLFARLGKPSVALERLFSYLNRPTAGRGATVTTRYERIKMQRRMHRRIRLVVEERRMAAAQRPERSVEADQTVELIPRAIGRVSIPR